MIDEETLTGHQLCLHSHFWICCHPCPSSQQRGCPILSKIKNIWGANAWSWWDASSWWDTWHIFFLKHPLAHHIAFFHIFCSSQMLSEGKAPAAEAPTGVRMLIALTGHNHPWHEEGTFVHAVESWTAQVSPGVPGNSGNVRFPYTWGWYAL